MRTLLERFNEKHTANGDGCWIWTGAKVHQGYGVIKLGRGRTQLRAHRASYELHIGPIPKGLYVCHRCDVRACVNPAHLFLGTNQDNVDDMMRKGRTARTIGAAHGAAKLTDPEVKQLRDAYAAGGISQRELGRRFGISQAVVSGIINRTRWAHVR